MALFMNGSQRVAPENSFRRLMLGLAVGLSMIAATLVLPAQAATDAPPDATVTVKMVPAGTSGTINVPVVVESDLNLSLGTVEVSYDSSILTATKCEGNPDDKFQLGLCNEEYADGVVRFNVAHPNGISGKHTLAMITFAVAGELSEDVEFGIAVSDFVDADVNVMEVRTVTDSNIESFPATDDPNSANIFLPLILR